MKRIKMGWIAKYLQLAMTVFLIGMVGFASSAFHPAANQASAATSSLTCLVLQPGPTPGKDSYIRQDNQDEKRGGDTELRVKSETGKLNRTLLEFDLSAIPANATVSSAVLSLYVKEVRDGNMTIATHQITNSWTESEVTWKARNRAQNLLWTNLGGDYNAATVSSAVFIKDMKNFWANWDITPLVGPWISNPATNFGVLLESSVTNPKSEVRFRSSDDGTAAQRPKLEICYSSALVLSPDNSAESIAGQTKTYTHTLSVASFNGSVNLSAVSSQGWTTRVYHDINNNGQVDGGEGPIASLNVVDNTDYPLLVQIDIPPGTQPGVLDMTTVTATAGAITTSATDRTRIGSLIRVAPSNSQFATPGTTLFYGHSITNNSANQICVNVTGTSSQGWTVQLWHDLNANGVHETSNPNEPPVSNPVCISGGGIYHLVAQVTVPVGATAGTVDQTVIKATLTTNAAFFGTATDRTEVFVNAPPVIDGKYDSIYTLSPDATEVCYNANGVLFGKLATFYQQAGDIYMVLAIDKDFVDNTYGTNAVGWPGGHTYSQLVGSDHAQFYGYDANGTRVLDFKLDYISTKTGTPSDYAALGVSGGEGKINIGSAANILQWGTSIEYSLNSTGYCSGGNCSAGGTNLLVNSPATNQFYAPNATYPNWIYDVIYEVKIASAAFGAAGFGSLEVPYIHASPSKLGSNTIYAEPGVCPGEIGDFVWHDLNGDGVQDAGEPGINGVQVRLYRDNGDGIFNAAQDTLVGTQTTSGGGRYLFQDLPPNDYFVHVEESTITPTGLSITTFNNPTSVISLDEGESYLEADFGYVAGGGAGGARIGDFIWGDTDQDGIQDAGEVGIANVVLNLYDNSNALVGTTTTDSSGRYYFTSLAVGNYEVQIAPSNFTTGGALNGYLYSPAHVGSNDEIDSDFNSATGRAPAQIVTANVDNLSVDGGFYVQTVFPAVIGDRVWEDMNGNGIQDGGELGISNVTVTLYNSSNNPISTTTTSASGLYSFTIPTAQVGGNFSVGFTLPSGYSFTLQNQGSNTAVDSDANPTTGRTIQTTLVSGEIDLTWDAGIYRTASLGDFVWNDLNRNGIQDGGEGGISGATVRLWNASLSTVLDTKVTTSTGLYLFSGLTPGSYFVNFSLPSGYVFTQRDQGGDDTKDSDANSLNGFTTLITLVSGQTDLRWDAGAYVTRSIGDFIWRDTNGNGVQNGGEPGIPGVELNLYDSNNDFLDSTSTDANGSYLFSNLPPGTYQVEIDPSNFAPGGPLYGYAYSPANVGSDTTDSDFISSTGHAPATLTAGVDNRDVDGGFVPLLPDYQISKTLNSPEPVRTGELISFTIRITNTGNVTITTLPMTDTYQTAYLSYVGATPFSNDNISDGVINWSDLTAPAPTGFGQDLGPGQSFSVRVNFIAVADTLGTPTVNTATVSGGTYDPDGPGGVPPQGPLSPKSANDTVEILGPTAANVVNYGVVHVAGQSDVAGNSPAIVRVHWETTTESNIAFFELYRIEGEQSLLLETIQAVHTGQPTGATYTYEDTNVVNDTWYEYQLKVFGPDGSIVSMGIGRVYTGGIRIFLPGVTR
ncbi:MAG: DNRLRE domain-containing protein [Caldilineaceae bacterium]|nr:DNRLRE domain-containing protein [Caldilineaceae bacterium]